MKAAQPEAVGDGGRWPFKLDPSGVQTRAFLAWVKDQIATDGRILKAQDLRHDEWNSLRAKLAAWRAVRHLGDEREVRIDRRAVWQAAAGHYLVPAHSTFAMVPIQHASCELLICLSICRIAGTSGHFDVLPYPVASFSHSPVSVHSLLCFDAASLFFRLEQVSPECRFRVFVRTEDR